MSIPREGQSQAAQSRIAGGPAEAKTVLPKERELKWFKKYVPYSIKHEYPDTPACPYGTLAEDNGSGKIPPDEPEVTRGS